MGDAQKSYKRSSYLGNDDKVFIPDTVQESDSDSESLSEKLKQIGAYGDEGQGCSKGVDHQVWRFGEFTNERMEYGMEEIMGMTKKADSKLSSEQSKEVDLMEGVVPATSSPEIFLSDDQIINTQGSGAEEGEDAGKGDKNANTDGCRTQENTQEAVVDTEHQKIRRSNRLRGEITKTTQERNDEMAKKRNLEGLYPELDRAAMEEGVKLMMRIAVKLLASKKAKTTHSKTGGSKDDGVAGK